MNSPAERVERSRRGVVEPAPDQAYVEGLATNLYHDRNFDTQAAKILPGEYYVTTRDMLLVTVLGSCVAACIRDSENGIGGMNHFMLPDEGGRDVVSNSARYGTYAMEVLINHLLKSGARRSRLEAKVFGGGAVLESLSSSNVGTRNAEFVLRFLQTEKIPVVAKDLLDSYPRKVYYFPKAGRVLVRKLHRVHNDTLFNREKEYRSRLEHSKVEGDIELFT
jgi:chemotaxis protein CheD